MRFINAVGPREADGLVGQVYGEIKRDFALLRDPDGNSPFLAHSPHPELLAGMWSVLYETILVDGTVRRADKEAIGATVSRINDCPFCAESHALLSGVAGQAHDRGPLISGAVDGIADQRRRELVAWAAATREPHSELVRSPPFEEKEAPEVIGTALAFHYVNRTVEFFQGHGPMQAGPAPLRGVMMALVGRIAARAIRRSREPGRSLRLLPEGELPPDLGWAAPAPAIAAAMARFAAAIERAGRDALPEPERARVTAALATWDGTDPPLHVDWLEQALRGLEPDARSRVRVALVAALAPYRIDDAAVESFKQAQPGDRDLVGAVAWSALGAARRVASWLAPSSLATGRPAISAPPGASVAAE
ncbi:MAG: alkylhydroperoxidase [Actinobacteria bacterium]|nr:MAG: alkylhydroperoxidase [Actinomycetota bacterium]